METNGEVGISPYGGGNRPFEKCCDSLAVRMCGRIRLRAPNTVPALARRERFRLFTIPAWLATQSSLDNGAAGCAASIAITESPSRCPEENNVRYETAVPACSGCSVMFLNDRQFDAPSPANPSLEFPPLVTRIRQTK